MKLSIIIVNYNVKYFLRQLLQSVIASQTRFEFETIVVDNASTDGSVAFIRKEFPQISLIANPVNLGFSKANNIAIRRARSPYLLLLNPDTILREDTLQLTVDHLDQHPHIAALGCRMIDGSGNFLPESKRGFPTPRVALFKALGLSSVFPKSKYFNSYYLGHLPENQISEVDVLTGAFMLLRKSVLDEIGLLDEDFFMYGEDIDLSYRIKKAGHAVVYYPETTIIHFKGESTQKQSAQYVRRFYGAMQVFAKKHYSGRRGFLLWIFLQLGIYLRGTIAMIGRYLKRIGPVILEGLVMMLVLKLFTIGWANFFYGDIHYYDASKIDINITIYTGVWLLTLFFSGAYDQLTNWNRLLKGMFLGWIVIAAMYGFLDPLFRPSRTLILLGGPLVTMAVLSLRAMYFRLENGAWPVGRKESKRYGVLGPASEAKRIRSLIGSSRRNLIYVGHIFNKEEDSASYLGEVEHLDQIVRFHQLSEIIFCSSSFTSSQIMAWMTKLGALITYKIAPEQPLGIIGSSSKNSSGELYTFDIKYNLGDTYIMRNKRIFDILWGMICLLTTPFTIWIVDHKSPFFQNIFSCLLGHKTWVSYGSQDAHQLLPPLKPGVLAPAFISYRENDEEALVDADYYYARDYSVWKDLSLVLNNFKNLGSTHLKDKN